MSDDLPPLRRFGRLKARPPANRNLVEGDTVPCILAVTERRPPGSKQGADDIHPTSFVVRHTTPIPEDPPPQTVLVSPFMPTAATDAIAKHDGDGTSPVKSLTWSSQTVAQFDDRCIQVAVDEFKAVVGGTEVEGRARRRLKSFRGLGVGKLADNAESSKYRPLCDTFNIVEEIAGSSYRWKIVANHGESPDVDHRPDLARYPKDVLQAKSAYNRKVGRPDDPNIARCAWAWMSSYVEVKNGAESSGFHFGDRDSDGHFRFFRDSDKGKIARAQFIKYATEAMLRQHRTHYYSIYISDMSVRVFRWDRVGCVATEPIDLRKDHKTFLNLLHRLATAEDNYGTDKTVTRATVAEISPIRLYKSDNKDLKEYQEMMLDDLHAYPIYKIKCPAVSVDGAEMNGAEKTYLIGRYAFGHWAVFGRCTRGYAAWDVEAKRIVFFKDQWRCVTRPYTELDAYVRLHEHSVRHIATPVAGGDIDDQRTVSQRFMTHLPVEWKPSERVHTRLVTREVGKVVEAYRDSPDLLHICGHAFIAHTDAYKKARILHRDVSIGNIMINVDTGKGFLNDWDLCKYREDLEGSKGASEPSGISGTWAFKSSHSLKYPRKPPELADDMESFIYVITFFGFRYHYHEMSPTATNDDSIPVQKQAASENNGLMGLINCFFYEQRRVGRGYYEGGATKRKHIKSGDPPLELRPLPNGRTPLIATFLDEAYKLLQEHYATTRPGRYEEFGARKNDQAAPDEGDDPPPDGPPGASGSRSESSSAPAGYAAKEEDIEDWRGWLVEEGAVIKDKKANPREVPVRPSEDPKRVLDDHVALGTLFASMVLDKDGNPLDLTGLRDDKRYDQFRCFDEFVWQRKKGKSTAHKGTPQGDSSMQQTAASKRSREVSPEDEPVPKRTTPLRRNAKGPENRPGRKVKFDVLVKTSATVSAKAKSQAQKATTSRKRTVPRKDTKAQNTKPARKAAASRQAQASRQPSSPRRAAALKAEVTAKTTVSRRAVVAAVALGMRRSKRLAGSEVAE